MLLQLHKVEMEAVHHLVLLLVQPAVVVAEQAMAVPIQAHQAIQVDPAAEEQEELLQMCLVAQEHQDKAITAGMALGAHLAAAVAAQVLLAVMGHLIAQADQAAQERLLLFLGLQ